MAETGADSAPPPRPRRRWPWFVLLALLLAGLAGAGLWALSETAAGRQFVARTLLPRLTLDNGVGIAVGRIDGSLLARPRLVDVALTDQDGVFATAPAVAIDWSARALLGGRIRLARLEAGRVELLRLPNLIPPPPEDPILPDLRLAIDRFAIGRLEVAEAVAGVAETVAIDGRIALADRVLVLLVDAAGAKGDRLRLDLDAEPDADRLDLAAELVGVPGGLVTAALGVAEPVRLDVTGEGGWARWRGVLNARVGEAPVATLGLLADAGRFAIAGTVRPAPLLPDFVAARLGEALALEARTEPEGGRTRLALALAGEGLSLEAGGLVDRGLATLSEGLVRLELADPARLAPGVAGAPLLLEARLEGPLRAPIGSWSVTAARLALADVGAGAEGVAAEGRLAWTGGRLTLPFALRAGRVSGLAPALADLLAGPELTGTVRQTADGYAATDLRFRAAGVTGAGMATLVSATGRWQLDLSADVPRYMLAEGSSVAAALSARLGPDVRGDVAGSGLVAVRALSLAEGLRGQLGGLPEARLPFRYADGRLLVRDGRVTAPRLALAGVALDYAPAGGQFRLSGAGSSPFGPVALRAEGTVAAPRVELRLASPGLALDLRDLLVEAVPVAGGFAVTASGATAQGPLALAGRVELPARGPLALDLARVSLAGIEASGRLVRTAAGPFAGRLAVTGAGLDGTLDFAAEGGDQRILLAGVAAQARLPLAEPVVIGAGTLDLTLLLTDAGPRLAGRLAARNIVRAGLRLSDLSAEGSATETGGEGRIAASGLWRGRMLRGRADIREERGVFLVGIDGRYGELPFRLAAPARISRTPDGWQLDRLRLVVPEGHVDAAGRFGRSSELRLVLAGVDLAVARLADADVAVRGRIDGQVELAFAPGDPLPVGRAQLRLRGFSRPSAVANVPMIDVDLEAESGRDGLAVAARLSGNRGSAGRLLLRLAPGSGDTLADRLLGGAIGGGLRYAGPAETPWSFLDVADQELTGPIGLALDFGGTLGSPRIAGGVRGRGLAYRNLGFGTRLTNIDIEGAFEGPRLVLSRLTADANGGTIRGEGSIRLEAEGGGAVDLALRLDRALIANSPTIRLVASGPLALRGSLDRATLSGALDIVEGRIELGQNQATAAAAIPVRRRGEGAPPAAAREAASVLRFDLEVRARDSVKVDGLGLDSFWGARIRVLGDANAPRLAGEAVLARGSYDFAGRAFEISRGRIGFTGAPLDSTLDIQASSRSEGFEAGVRISGTAARPEIGFTSSPPLPEDEVLARLLFGTSVADLSVTEAVQLATALASLRGGGGGFDPVGRLQRASGIDRIRLQGASETTGLGTAIAIGERIGRRLYVEVATDTSGNALTTIEFAINRVLGLLAQVTTLGDASVNLRYSRDY